MNDPVIATFRKQVPLSDLCTFGIGGPARYCALVLTVEEMRAAILACVRNRLPYLILGKGSNCLFDDRGFDGVVLVNKIDFLERPAPGQYHVGAGFSFSRLGAQTAREGWSGLEFASGIPGSVGGAVFMNAGANGRETAASLVTVDFLTETGEFKVLRKEELTFAYRTSCFQKMNGAIVGATFQLDPSDSARALQLQIVEYRTKTQPYGDKSAGCIFQNPECGHAGALIDQCGLKGLSIGDAKVSEKHANFIINAGSATSEDVQALIALVQKRVQERTGVVLKSEVRVF